MARLPHDLEIAEENVHLGSRRKPGGGFIVQLGSKSYELEAGRLGTQGFWFRDTEGQRHRAFAAAQGEGMVVRLDGRTWAFKSAVHEQGAGAEEQDPSQVMAPMTGTLISVMVSTGDSVHEGQDLAVLSAMKMEHKLTATAAGTVSEVLCAETDTVDAGQILIRLEILEKGSDRDS